MAIEMDTPARNANYRTRFIGHIFYSGKNK